MPQPLPLKAQSPYDIDTLCAVQALYLLDKIQSGDVNRVVQRIGRPAQAAYLANGGLRVLLEHGVYVFPTTTVDVRLIASRRSRDHLQNIWLAEGRTQEYVRRYLPRQQPSLRKRALATMEHIKKHPYQWWWTDALATPHDIIVTLLQDKVVRLKVPNGKGQQELVAQRRHTNVCWTFNPSTGIVAEQTVQQLARTAQPHIEAYSTHRSQ